uniref:Uncharacterized protein n=1 Tax=Oryza punctata TaxID=4537 RepID=A0A0E0KSC3_ORYPU
MVAITCAIGERSGGRGVATTDELLAAVEEVERRHQQRRRQSGGADRGGCVVATDGLLVVMEEVERRRRRTVSSRWWRRQSGGVDEGGVAVADGHLVGRGGKHNLKEREDTKIAYLSPHAISHRCSSGSSPALIRTSATTSPPVQAHLRRDLPSIAVVPNLRGCVGPTLGETAHRPRQHQTEAQATKRVFT